MQQGSAKLITLELQEQSLLSRGAVPTASHEFIDEFVYHAAGECPPTPDGTALSVGEDPEEEPKDAKPESEAQSEQQHIAMEPEIFGIDALLDELAFSGGSSSHILCTTSFACQA